MKDLLSSDLFITALSNGSGKKSFFSSRPSKIAARKGTTSIVLSCVLAGSYAEITIRLTKD